MVAAAADATLGRRLARLDLSRLALAAAACELVLDRILPAVSSRRLPPGLDTLAAFARHFSAALCVLVLVVALVLTLSRRDLFAAPARVLFGLVGAVLAPLLGWAALAPMPTWLGTQVETSFLFLALACIYATVRMPIDTRCKAGLTVLTMPLLARGYALAAGSYEALSFGRLDVRQLAEHLGEAAALVAGVAAPLLLPPRGNGARLARRQPLLIAIGAVLAVGALAAFRFATLQAAAAALGFSLPDEPGGRLIYMAALFGTVWTVAALIDAPGSGRLVGCGLALVAVSGYSMARASELAATALGLLLVLWGQAGAEALDPLAAPPPVDPERWLADARALAARLHGECILVNDDDRQITRLSGHAGERPVVVRVVREGGFDAIEVVVGTPPAEGTPEIEVEERPGAADDLPFERRYRVRAVGAAPLSAAARAALLPHGGATALWSGRGARWRHRVRSPAPVERVPAIVDALETLVRS